MIVRRRFLCLSAAALLAPAATAAATPPHLWRGTALGADVALRVDGGDARAARAFFGEAVHRLRFVEDRFSLFRGSDLQRLNATGRLAHPAPEMVAMLRLADDVHRATAGQFDPTVHPLWQARRIDADPAAAQALIGWADVRVTDLEISFARPGMALTLNGIAQGFAADLLAETARRHGLSDVLIDAGETRAIGPRAWQARVVTPDGKPVRDLTLRDRALATSSPFGTRIGPAGDLPHILSPDGRAPKWGVVSVSATQAALADALSTAFCMMERSEIDRALDAFPDAQLEALANL